MKKSSLNQHGFRILQEGTHSSQPFELLVSPSSRIEVRSVRTFPQRRTRPLDKRNGLRNSTDPTLEAVMEERFRRLFGDAS